MTQLAAGMTIGPFVVESVLGAGGMGVVYRAHDDSGNPVALKVMSAQAAQSIDARRRFAREARATMALSHPNVIRVLGSLSHGDIPVIAMEMLRGSSLKQRLEAGRLEFDTAVDVFARVAAAVGTAHALGLVHRDLKPDNLFLLDDAPHVKVLDFGIAKIQTGGALDASGALTRTGMMVGTPYYMSPEQAFGDKSIDHRSDIWSLGMMLYESLTGLLPTRAPSLETVFTRMMTMQFVPVDQLDPSIPGPVARLIDRMLQRDRNQRPADLRVVYETLATYAQGTPSVAEFDGARTPLSFSEAGPDSALVPAQAAPPAATQADATVMLDSNYGSFVHDDPPVIARVRGDLLLWLAAVLLVVSSAIALVVFGR
jgi:eukaryotic-like serine/threonine-protein kinase